LLLLLPLFFALAGIRTNLNFQAGARAYFDLLLILLVAVVSKWGGIMFAARAKGIDWREGRQLGLMMNARGLVELIVLNVGLDSGVLSRALFSMMVFMAGATTIMTTPLMDRFSAARMRSRPESVGA
jgi:Kef-type K+ transport system membrane component KefB